MPANRRRSDATAPPERWQLLGRLLEDRRKELGYTYRFSSGPGPSFERDSGVNRRMAADIEKAAKDRINRFMPGTLHIIARGYRVTEESVRAVLRGEAGELTPVPPPDEDTPPMSPERAAAGQSWYDEINERRVALAARRIMNPTGAQMFGAGTADAKAWDDHAHWSVADRVWFIAEVRRQVDGRLPNSGTGTAGA